MKPRFNTESMHEFTDLHPSSSWMHVVQFHSKMKKNTLHIMLSILSAKQFSFFLDSWARCSACFCRLVNWDNEFPTKKETEINEQKHTLHKRIFSLLTICFERFSSVRTGYLVYWKFWMMVDSVLPSVKCECFYGISIST